MDKRIFKKTGEELEQYLAFKRKHGVVPAKKGKGSYKRKGRRIQKKSVDNPRPLCYNKDRKEKGKGNKKMYVYIVLQEWCIDEHSGFCGVDVMGVYADKAMAEYVAEHLPYGNSKYDNPAFVEEQEVRHTCPKFED